MKIFILEDDFALNKIIKKSLQDYDFIVDSCLMDIKRWILF